MASAEDKFTSALPAIRGRANDYDRSGEFPADDLADLAAAGAMRFAIPTDCGGEDLPSLDIHLKYEQLAAVSLSTALLLSQRDSAVGMIDGAQDWPLRAQTLRKLANNEFFTTIGIAQLTTSRQGGRPALRARRDAGGYRIEGLIPWSTGPARSAFVMAGAAIEDSTNQQILFALPTDLPKVRIDPPLPLVALRSSFTTQVHCDGALLEEKWILRGPVERALASRKKGVPLGQAFLAMGLCRGALDLIAEHDSARARSTRDRFQEQLSAIRQEVLRLCSPAGEAEVAAASARIRGECNDLAVRLTHAAVALYKGTALLADHPAQRLARETLFLLVWSCPDPVIDCTIEILSGE
ncbi:MAG TPA: acyl-CoA dehydrogenase family protein [Tepidisphaeraceae bacterium]|jgi:alkylation response protein AidB-like acyl-CoA dehydrogenase